MPRDTELIIDMLAAARTLRAKAIVATRVQFDDDDDMQRSWAHPIQIIGEAARGVSDECRRAHTDIPWSDIVGMRRRIVHDYLNIQLDRVWRTVQNDIPVLIAQLEPLVLTEEPE